ncbi:two-component regulator propeller domain-containing protein [Cesiribacter sp. SM1]|uniref:two-component regulator propeller domain-containing protein n=1 Tax=Cesiribacter sp. SM1 TaxID=2861196 RepID=UPI001CD4D4A9|nr:two-component regulator propeller domain-containing protein [Cesiribacter sp. SM1]
MAGVFCSTGAFAQTQQDFFKINKSKDLSGGSVTSITQDSDGFIWIATKSGLSRYDGSTFKVYAESSGGLSADDVSTIFIDSKQRMWVGTIDGLNLFNASTDKFISFKNLPEHAQSISSNEINTIYETIDRTIWIGTENGLNKFVEQDSSFISYQSNKADSSALSHNSVKSIFEDAAGGLWIGTFGGGLNRFDRKNQRFDYYQSSNNAAGSLAPRHIYVLYGLDRERILVGTAGNGLLIYNRSSREFKPFFVNQPDQKLNSVSIIRSLFKSQDSSLWVGTDGDGLIKIENPLADKPKITRFVKNSQVQGSLSSNAIYAVFLDREANVWVGTAWHGINVLVRQDEGIQHYYSDFEGTNLSPVLSIYKEQERLWFGTDGFGLNISQGQGGQISRLAKGEIGGDYIQMVKKRRAGAYFIGTFANGLIIYDPKKGILEHYRHRPQDAGSLSFNDVRDIIEEEGGNFWVASWGGGLSYYDHTQKGFRSFRKDSKNHLSISSDNAVSLEEATDGKIWIGTFGGGLNLFDPTTGRFTAFLSSKDDPNTISSNNIISLLKDGRGNLWIGTWDQGLCRFDAASQTFVRYAEAQGLHDKTIMALAEDQQDALWVSTKSGIYKFDVNTGLFQRFPQLDGEYRINSAFADGEWLYFGKNEGVVAFKPAALKVVEAAVPIHFTGIKLFNKELKLGEEGVLDKPVLEEDFIELAHDHSVVTFDFAALAFPSANYEYAIKLEGLDEDWREIGNQRSATFTNLAPGQYSFKVKARIPGGSWGDSYKSLAVLVHKPFWKMWWAYVVYVLVFSFLLYLFYRYTIQWEKLQNKLKLEKITREKEQELSKLKLKFFTDISHEIRTPVTLMIGAVNRITEKTHTGSSREAAEQIRKNGSHLLHLMNELLDFRRLESKGVKLKAAPGNFVRFVHEVYLSFSSHAASANIQYEFRADAEEISLWFDRDQMEKVVYNLLSNAFKFTDAGGRIKVMITRDDQHVHLMVEDTGKGIPAHKLQKIFKRFKQNEGGANPQMEQGFGIGLSIAKGIVKLHGGEIFVESEEGQGSKFVVKLLPGADHLSPDQQLLTFRDSESLEHYTLDEGILEGISVQAEQVITAGVAGASLLVVEDNEGIRKYLQQLLSPLFQVGAAANGREAYEIAIAQMPDLIISDVMMPEMDGISLVKALKSDVRTSHIPVVLLTARTSLIFKKEGLETGADDYVTKPFSESLLKTRIINLLKNRQLLREKFQLELVTEPGDIAITTSDQKFLADLTRILDEQLDNPELKAELIAREIGISHSVIYKKIKSLTGLSLVEFIRDYRLKCAARLLSQYALPVVDVCVKVGFSDRKYFSQMFKKRFGKSPSEWSKIEDTDSSLA